MVVASARAVVELLVRIKMVIIVAGRKVIILFLLLLPATEEESLLCPGVQKVIWLSSCSWMTKIFTKDRWVWDGKSKILWPLYPKFSWWKYCYKSFTAPPLLPCKGEGLSNWARADKTRKYFSSISATEWTDWDQVESELLLYIQAGIELLIGLDSDLTTDLTITTGVTTILKMFNCTKLIVSYLIHA